MPGTKRFYLEPSWLENKFKIYIGKFCDKSLNIYAKMMQKLYNVSSEMVMSSTLSKI